MQRVALCEVHLQIGVRIKVQRCLSRERVLMTLFGDIPSSVAASFEGTLSLLRAAIRCSATVMSGPGFLV
jgi:hypothetical protein